MYIKKWLCPGDPLDDAYAIRTEVFVEEQGFQREIEIDELDPLVHHLVLYGEDGKPAATGRVFPDSNEPGTFIIGRVAVRRCLRGSGVGRILMEELEKEARRRGARRIVLGAQLGAQPFYTKCGYSPFGEEYLEEHCRHVHMRKALAE